MYMLILGNYMKICTISPNQLKIIILLCKSTLNMQILIMNAGAYMSKWEILKRLYNYMNKQSKKTMILVKLGWL